MIYHTLHTCTIDNFGLCFEFPSNVKRIPIPLPKKWVMKAFSRLISDYNKLTAKDKVDDLLDNKYFYADLENRIQMFYNMYLALKNTIVVEAPKIVYDEFKNQFRKEFQYDDLELIIRKIELLRAKQKSIKINEETNDSNAFDFNDLIIGIERYIYPYKIRNDKLIHITRFMKQADEAKKLAELNNR